MTAPHNPTPPEIVWGSEARTAASLLLFVHLFAVVMAVAAYTRPSLLQLRLNGLFDPYVRNLHLTAYPVSYPFARYHLTHALPIDLDFTCQVDVQDPAGNEQSVALPPDGLQPAIRQQRYQRLINAAGSLADEELNEDAAGVLSKTIAASILRQNDATQGTIRLRAHYLPEIEDVASGSTARGERLPGTADVYEAQVFMSDGRVELLKKSTTLEVAPVESGPVETPPRPSSRQQRSASPNRSE